VDRFAYPFRWYYNVLNAAEYFRQASLLDGAAPDPRMADAIEVIRAARRPDGTWLQAGRDPGRVWFEVDVPAGEPSKWLTLAVRECSPGGTPNCPADDSTFTIANRCNGSRVRRPKMSGDAAASLS
jgi:hypothetical protein